MAYMYEAQETFIITIQDLFVFNLVLPHAINCDQLAGTTHGKDLLIAFQIDEE